MAIERFTGIDHEDAHARELPRGLIESLRKDPLRAPEHVALAAARQMAPDAAAWAAEKRSRLNVSHRDLAKMAKQRHAALARVGGAATGVGGFITVVPDLVVASWIQARLVFFIAAAYGYDPHDRMRPAELLVLRDLYDTPADARRALDGIGSSVAERYVGNRVQREETLVKRLARFVGRRTVRRLGGRLIPGFAIIFNAVGNERETRALADRAIEFYGGR